MMEVEKGKMGYEETELRLGLPLAATDQRKRGFSETETPVVELKLNLSTKEADTNHDHSTTTTTNYRPSSKDNNFLSSTTDSSKPPAKTQVVGWPPVRSFRKYMMTVQKRSNADHEQEHEKKFSGGGNGRLVKVSVDGAPYLRKVDLKTYKSYEELLDSLGNMFNSFTMGNCGSEGILKDFMKENKLKDLLNGTDYVPTYEDKDGDWMLIGDVPWVMFVESCKRLRIMKGTEATGLAPRAMEKCKKRSYN